MNEPVLSPRLQVARRATRVGSAELLSRFGATLEAESKATPADVVTEADRASERAILACIATEFPDDAVLGEESGATGDEGRRWCVDPLDGTANFIRGLPIWATSVAYGEDEDVQCGVVSNPPIGDEWYADAEGRLGYNGQTVTARRHTAEALDSALAITRIKVSPGSPRSEVLARASAELGLQRYLGCAALQLAWLAEGRCDLVYYEYAKLFSWDVAAGTALCRAAGIEARWLPPAAPEHPRRFVAGPRHLVEQWLSLTERESAH